MAVDTAQKRFSILNMGWVPGQLLFEPDGTVDADDKAMCLHLYSGIALNNPSSGFQAAWAASSNRIAGAGVNIT